MDILWTDIGQGQTLDITQIQWPTLGPSTDIGHCLDNYGILTYSGLILDLMVYILIFHFLLQDLGQQLDIIWTRQIVDSSWI